MNKQTKRIVVIATAAALTFGLVSFSCKANKGSANVAFADTVPAVSIPQDSLAVVEAMQGTFRAVSNAVLPSVVEVDIKEKKTMPASPLDNIPFFFFGMPNQGNGDDDNGSSGSSKGREYTETGLGSGVIVRRSGKTVYVLTNNHVAGSATEITVKLHDEREYTGKLVGADERQDIALVSFETDDKDIVVAKLGDSSKVQTGDICLALGSPLGYFASVTQGIVSATGRSGAGIGNVNDFIQTDAAINQGNSGGPLVNIYGEVIGINTWIASQSGGSQGLGFAMPINNIKKAIDEFIDKGKITYGWLGVSLVDITKEYKQDLGVGSRTGAFAAELFLDSPAQKGGMQAGDFITQLDGHDVKTVDQLVREVGNLTAGSTATFTVIRGGNEITLTVKIEERAKDVAANNSKLWPGFIAAPLNDDVRKELKIDDKSVKGIAVTNVQEKSPAAALRLQNGDVITAVNDKKVTSVAEFYAAMDIAHSKEIWFDVYSNGSTISTGHYKVGK